MSHLKIEQNTSSVEVITSTIIDKLYELAQSGTLDSSSNLKGNLQVAHAYEDAVTYLTTNYANLQINVTGGAYIRFADATVQSICATNWGDGTGITTIQAAVVNNIGGAFKNNTAIVSFTEFAKFTSYGSAFTKADDNRDTFRQCTKLVSITIPASLQLVQSCMFYQCTNLTSVGNTENNAFKIIYDSAFNGTKITTLNVSQVTYIYDSAFTSCTSLTSLNLNSCVTIEHENFKYCSALVSAGVTSALKTIGYSAFQYCSSLVSPGDTSGLTVIPPRAFEGCKKLTTIDTSNVVTIDDERAFADCTSLTAVNLQNCTRIGANAFLNCVALTSIGDTSKVTYIGSYGPFNNTPNLKVDFNFPSLQTINGNCSGSGFTNVISMGTITTCSGTFKGCASLLTAVFPETCSYLGGSIVENCTKLRWVKVLYHGVATLDAQFAFSNSNNCPIYVVDAYLDAYKTASIWSGFSSRLKALSTWSTDFPNG